MSKPKLKPCPFCGKKARTFHIPENKKGEGFQWNYSGMWVVGCNTDMCIGNIGHFAMIFVNEKDAIKAWNRRASNE